MNMYTFTQNQNSPQVAVNMSAYWESAGWRRNIPTKVSNFPLLILTCSLTASRRLTHLSRSLMPTVRIMLLLASGVIKPPCSSDSANDVMFVTFVIPWRRSEVCFNMANSSGDGVTLVAIGAHAMELCRFLRGWCPWNAQPFLRAHARLNSVGSKCNRGGSSRQDGARIWRVQFEDEYESSAALTIRQAAWEAVDLYNRCKK